MSHGDKTQVLPPPLKKKQLPLGAQLLCRQCRGYSEHLLAAVQLCSCAFVVITTRPS